MPKQSKFWKYLFIIIISLLAIIITTFLIFFIYYSIQFKYGNKNDIQKITQKYEQNFSTAVDKNAPQDITDYSKLIQKHNPKIGDKNAKITVIAFVDFECPFSQASYPIFAHVLEKYKPVLQVIYKNLPLAELHPNATSAALATTCANEQNKFWEFYNQAFTTKKLDTDSLYSYATTLGLDMTKFDLCYKSQKYEADLEQDMTDAVSIGLRGTPTYLVNGEIVEGSISSEEWDKIIIKNLNK
ncbi:MAG: thioredoxin domain-containing protein [Candidatus Magasanikbacteria bacterium]